MPHDLLSSLLPPTLVRRIDGRQPGEVALLTAKTLAHAARALRPAARRARRADAAFDRRWGTDTGGVVNLSALDVARDRALLGYGYQASSGQALREAVAAGGIAPERFAFVDYGSGKGRIVLLAAAVGFRRAIGVEFAPELHRIAERNADRFLAAGGASRRAEPVLGDAGAFEPPPGPVFAYIYNSFGYPVLREALARLERRAAEGDEVVVAYVNPRCPEAFEDGGRWTAAAEGEGWALYRPNARSSPGARRSV